MLNASLVSIVLIGCDRLWHGFDHACWARKLTLLERPSRRSPWLFLLFVWLLLWLLLFVYLLLLLVVTGQASSDSARMVGGLAEFYAGVALGFQKKEEERLQLLRSKL